MAAFFARRMAASLLLVLLVLTLIFFLIQLAPGDPTALLIDSSVPRDHREALRRIWGLDRPLPLQYLAWLKAVALDFDWGISLQQGRPVSAILGRYLLPTLTLTGAALAIQYLAGLALGVWAARRRGSAIDHLIRIASLLLYSMPTFWIGLMALLLFSHLWPLFPPGQMQGLGSEELSAGGRLLDRLHHLALPALVLGLASSARIARLVRNSLLDVLSEEYVRTARAKGVSEGRVVWVHALRNALAPTLQLLGLSLPFLLSGALVLEVVFSWPGMGRLTYEAILARDFPLILASAALTGVAVVIGNLAADLLHAWVDPRVRTDAA